VTCYILRRILNNNFHGIRNLSYYLYLMVRSHANDHLATKYIEEERIIELDILENDIALEEDGRTDFPFLDQDVVYEVSDFINKEINSLISTVSTNPYMKSKKDDYLKIILYCTFYDIDVRKLDLGFRSDCLVRYLSASTFERISSRVNHYRSR